MRLKGLGRYCEAIKQISVSRCNSLACKLSFSSHRVIIDFLRSKLQVGGLKSAVKREKDQEDARKQDMGRLTLMVRDEKKSKNKIQKQDRRQNNINKRTEAILKSEKNIKEWEEELRVLQVVQVANTTKSALAENPVLKHFLESVDGDFGTNERRDLLAVEDLEGQTPGQLFLER